MESGFEVDPEDPPFGSRSTKGVAPMIIMEEREKTTSDQGKESGKLSDRRRYSVFLRQSGLLLLGLI